MKSVETSTAGPRVTCHKNNKQEILSWVTSDAWLCTAAYKACLKFGQMKVHINNAERYQIIVFVYYSTQTVSQNVFVYGQIIWKKYTEYEQLVNCLLCS